jgi:hypothetical protein
MNAKNNEKPKEIVKEIVSRYIQAKPRRISLKLYWEDKRSTISVNGDGLNEKIEHPQTIDFTSFAEGVLEAYREAYGELEVVPISFREEIYRNDRVSLDLYPTGSEGVFDIFVEYKDKGKYFSQL